jgi:hypothetical protein
VLYIFCSFSRRLLLSLQLIYRCSLPLGKILLIEMLAFKFAQLTNFVGNMLVFIHK